MTFDVQRAFQATMDALTETASFVTGFADDHGIGRSDALRLTLVVEELFTNTVKHGYGCDSGATIRIALSAIVDEIALFYEDGAPPFDPLSRLSGSLSSVNADIESRHVGGLGIYLVGQLSGSPRYAYEDGCNRLWLKFRRQT
jgi:serine/threonine-protein kinase RsbW